MLAKIITFSRLRLIEKDYRTPIIATCLFLILVAVLLGLKLHDHAIVSQVLSQNSSTGQNYAELLSRDKVDKFDGSQVDTTDAPDNSASTKSAASSSTTFKTGAGSTTSSAPSASSGGGGSSGGTGSTPAPVQVVPFSAAITSFHEEKTHTTSCQHGSKLSDCSRTYYYAAAGNRVGEHGQPEIVGNKDLAIYGLLLRRYRILRKLVRRTFKHVRQCRTDQLLIIVNYDQRNGFGEKLFVPGETVVNLLLLVAYQLGTVFDIAALDGLECRAARCKFSQKRIAYAIRGLLIRFPSSQPGATSVLILIQGGTRALVLALDRKKLFACTLEHSLTDRKLALQLGRRRRRRTVQLADGLVAYEPIDLPQSDSTKQQQDDERRRQYAPDKTALQITILMPPPELQVMPSRPPPKH